MNLAVLLVDDEKGGLDYLSKMMELHCESVISMHTARSIEKAKKLIEEINFDVAFLDIKMPGGGGFELLEDLGNWNFEVVFTTAYDEYAIEAFRTSALDYLLKPVQQDHLVEAMQKVAKARRNLTTKTSATDSHRKMMVPDGTSLHFIDVEDIVKIEANGNYSWIYLNGRDRIHANVSLKELDSKLEPSIFVRIHHSHIINTDFLKTYTKATGDLILMDGSELVVSRSRRNSFNEKLATGFDE